MSTAIVAGNGYYISKAAPNEYDQFHALVMGYDPDLAKLSGSTWEKARPVDSNTVIWFIRDSDSKPVGFVIHVAQGSTWDERDKLYLSDVYVDPLHRRKGCCTMAVQHAIDRVKTEGFSRVDWVTRNENPARHCYDKFIESGYVFYYYYPALERQS